MTLREAPDSAHRSGFPRSDAESAGRRSVESLSVDEIRDSRLLEPECCRSRILRSWTGQWKSHWNIRFQREWRSRYRAPSGSLRRVPVLVPAATSAGRHLELRLSCACGLTRTPGLGTIPLGTGTRLGMRPGSGDCERGSGGCGMATRHVLKRRRLARLAPSVESEPQAVPQRQHFPSARRYEERGNRSQGSGLGTARSATKRVAGRM